MKQVGAVILSMLLLLGFTNFSTPAFSEESENAVAQTDANLDVEQEAPGAEDSFSDSELGGDAASESEDNGTLNPDESVENEENEMSGTETLEGTDEEVAVVELSEVDESIDSEELSKEDETIEENEIDDGVMLFSELLGATLITEKLSVTQDARIDQPMLAEVTSEIFLEDGMLTIEDGQTFENNGFIQIEEGTLLVKSGAVLINRGFIEVTGNGALIVEEGGSFVTYEGSVLRLDQSDIDAKAQIEGISHDEIELTVFVSNAEDLNYYLQDNEFAFITVVISDPAYVGQLDFSAWGTNKAISLIG